ncbi:inner nuclear membrane protein enriched at telomere/subtelomere region [Kluyveromyces marxianus]|nr:inner nuclear membrane protein enriched at telomere/subtelomere region [Kluyveromyces marxianus]
MSKEEGNSSFNESLLKEDFDPASLKIAELKTVLTSNEIGFKAHDKKAALVKLVEENLDTIKKNVEKDGITTSSHGKVKVTKKRESSKKKRKSATPDALEKSLEKAVRHVKSTPISTPVKEEKEEEEGNSSKVVAKKRKKKSKGNELDKEESRSKTSKKRTKGDESDVEEGEKPDKKARKTKKKKNVSKEGSYDIKSATGSPITKKITKKSPIKSPHRSLIIDKFESSDDASDDSGKDDSFVNFSIKRTSKSNSAIHSSPKSGTASADVSADASGRTVTRSNESTKIMETPQESTPIKLNSKSPRANNALRELENQVEQEELENPQRRIPTPTFPTIEEVQKLQDQVTRSINTDNTEASENISTSEQQIATDREETSREEESISGDKTKDECIKKSAKSLFTSLGHFLIKPNIFLLIMLPIIFGLWYREQRIAVGFCGSEIDIPLLGKEYTNPYVKEFESRLSPLKPDCLPCPENAICFPYMNIKCKPGYIIEKSIFSLHGLVPIHDSCIKDSKKQKLVQEVVKKTLELLRTKNAQESCGECEDDIKSGVSNEELYEIFYESKKPWINDEEFNALWEQVEVDLKEEPEIIWRQVSIRLNPISDGHPPEGSLEVDGQTGHFQETGFQKGYFRSTSKKYIGLKCQFERQVHSTWNRYQWLVVSTFSILVALQILKRYISKKLQEREMIEKISEQVIKRLQQVVIKKIQPSYMSSVQLRDLILKDVNDLNEKNRIWTATTKRLDSNTNVKSTLMEIHGEIMKCWEWIGVLPINDDDNKTEQTENANVAA